MSTYAFRTKLAAGREEEYERMHASIPPTLSSNFRSLGVTEWSIWRDGLDLFHVIDVADFEAFNSALEDDAAHASWQAKLSELLDYSAGAVMPIRRVWSFADDAGAARRSGS